MPDIFVSYSRTDKPLAEPLVAALQARGWSVWWDMDLAPGSDFDAATAEALKNARAVVVIWTPTSASSRWVRGEARIGADRGVLIPVRFENAELPIDLRAIHTADLDGWTGDAQHDAFRKLEQSLAVVLKPAPSATPTPTPKPSPALPQGKPSIAVLPFAELGAGADQDYFADGMVEEIAMALSRFPSLMVIDSRSSLTYRDDRRPPDQIAEELGVRYLLDGAVRRSAGRVRISVKMVDPAEREQIWAEHFDGVLEDVFALQDAVANAVAAQIEPTVQAAEIRRASARPTQEPSAYDLYLRGMAIVRSWDRDRTADALAHFEAAIDRDPDYARALIMAAWCLGNIAVFSPAEEIDSRRQAGIAYVRRALGADPDDPEVLGWLGACVVQLGGDAKSAAAMIERALQRHPGSAVLHLVRGWLLACRGGSPDLAIQHAEVAQRLDPRSPHIGTVLATLGLSYFELARFDEAISAFAEYGQRQFAVWPVLTLTMAAAQAHMGRLAAAGATLRPLPKAVVEGALAQVRPGRFRDQLLAGLVLAEGPESG